MKSMWKIAMLEGPPACLVSHQTEGPLGKVLWGRTLHVWFLV